MRFPVIRLCLVLGLALAAASGAAAQDSRSQTVLPVLDSSGKVEAFLVLEPTSANLPGRRWRMGESQFDAAFGLQAGSSLALLCSPGSSFTGAVSNLARNCQLASVGETPGRRASATASMTRPGGGVGVTLGESRETLPGWLSSSRAASAGNLELHDLTVFAKKDVGDDAYVSLAGTLAKATLIPTAAAPATLSDQWTSRSRSLSVGGGIGRFSANIVGQVVDTPGLPKWEGVGLGVSWRTPWSGQLTVGADNVITRGKNPFSKMTENADDEGAVPYIRYQQDL